MTKGEYIEINQRRLAGGNVTPDVMGKYHPEDIARWISSAFNQVIYATFRKNIRDLDLYAKTYKNVPVLFDTDLEIYYSNLPDPIIQLPNGKAIRKIAPMVVTNTYPEDTIKIVGDNEKSVISRMEAGMYGQGIWATFNSERIEYKYMSPDIQNVMIKQVTPFYAYDIDDEFFIPSGTDFEVSRLVKEFMLGSPPEDIINDNNSKQA